MQKRPRAVKPSPAPGSALSSVRCGRLSGRLETPDKQQQRDCGQCQPRDDTEAVHEGQKTHLTLKLLVQISLRSRSGVRTREALRHEIVRQRGDPVAQLLRRGAYVRSEICLMERMPAFRRRCDESNPKTASPVPEKAL
jgi:hypothetical protein